MISQLICFSSVPSKDTECFCGQKDKFIQVKNLNYISFYILFLLFQPTVIGGDFTEINEYPWAALLNLKNLEKGSTARCGGSLISDRFELDFRLLVF